jgi:hypothetical protein
LEKLFQEKHGGNKITYAQNHVGRGRCPITFLQTIFNFRIQIYQTKLGKNLGKKIKNESRQRGNGD